MAQSPDEQSQVAAAHDPNSSFRRNLNRLNDWVRNGRSLSGYERNCCFLNLGTGKFATVSAISGFDFDDDGRALSVVDWDDDGDLDVWVANRTGPRLRFLCNNADRTNNFVAFQLQGTRCNYDAIGARVEVVVSDSNMSSEGAAPGGQSSSSVGRLVRTLRAGEGYLGQSSKVLHFGLGTHRTIDNVLVTWPGESTPELFNDVEVNSKLVLVQGSGTPRRQNESSRTVSNPATLLSHPDATDRAHIRMADGLQLPPLRYRDWKQNDQLLTWNGSQPTVINLWASWCAPCAKEWREWNDQADRLSKAGIRLVGLSLDAVDQQPMTAADASKQFQKMSATFLGGLATRESLETLQTFHDLPFRQTIAMGVPTTFLVSGQGKLIAIYRGPVTVERWIEDLKLADQSEADRLQAVLPFPGRWFTPPHPLDPTPFVVQLAERECWPEAADFVRNHWERLARNPASEELLVWLGDRLLNQKQGELGTEMLEFALTKTPENVAALNNLAWHYAAGAPGRDRNPNRAVELAEKAARLSGEQQSPILDTLAAAYAANGRYDDAIRVTQQAMQLVRSSGTPEELAALEEHLKLYQMGRPLP